MRRGAYILVGLFFMVTARAESAIGWLWYNAVFQTTPQKPPAPLPKAIPSAAAQMHTFRKRVLEAKARAILYPTEKNVRTYIRLQQLVVTHARNFAAKWQKVLLDFPALDYSIAHPTENNAQHVLSVVQSAQEDAAIARFAKHDGLFFFYRGKKLLDQTLAPSIVTFAKKYHIALLPVSVDGKTLSIFPRSWQDKGQARALHLRYFPALILVNPTTGAHQPVSYGFIALDELKRRFLNIATHFVRAV